ncbi:UNVERIFIED_CONTAM: hypothetical protein K2H54_008535 [Gekko kuhli]
MMSSRAVALPLSRRLGLQEKVRRKPSPNAVLEAFYSKHQKGPEEPTLPATLFPAGARAVLMSLPCITHMMFPKSAGQLV